MHQCPACKRDSISSFKAWSSSVSSPAYCTACSELSYATSNGQAVGAIMIVLLGVLAAAVLKTNFAVIVAVILAILFYVWRWRAAVLVHYVPADLEHENRRGIIYTVLNILGVLSIFQ